MKNLQSKAKPRQPCCRKDSVLKLKQKERTNQVIKLEQPSTKEPYLYLLLRFYSGRVVKTFLEALCVSSSCCSVCVTCPLATDVHGFLLKVTKSSCQYLHVTTGS